MNGIRFIAVTLALVSLSISVLAMEVSESTQLAEPSSLVPEESIQIALADNQRVALPLRYLELSETLRNFRNDLGGNPDSTEVIFLPITNAVWRLIDFNRIYTVTLGDLTVIQEIRKTYDNLALVILLR